MSLLRARVAAGEASRLGPGQMVAIEGDEAFRLVRVSRARPGEAIELFDGEGRAWRARVASISRGRLVCRVEGIGASAEPALRVILIQAILKAGRMELALEKATELGAAEIWLARTHRSVVRPEPGPVRVERWRRVVENAARQCGRARFPELRGPMEWEQAIASLAHQAPRWPRLLAYEGARHSPQAATEDVEGPSPEGVGLAVGPEGGLEAEEVEMAIRAGFQVVGLGPRVLRAETASVVLLALTQARWGDLRGFPGPAGRGPGEQATGPGAAFPKRREAGQAGGSPGSAGRPS